MEYVVAVAATPWLSPLPTRLGTHVGASASPRAPRRTPVTHHVAPASPDRTCGLPPAAAPAPTPASTGNGIQAP